MSEPTVCRHCGYFINHVIPKAPAEPGWVHMPYTPTKPAGPHCDHPEPLTAPTLSEFLLARIAEDEAVAREAGGDTWEVADERKVRWTRSGGNAHGWVAFADLPTAAAHLTRWDPARVLAECEAKRRIVDFYRAVPDGMQEHYRAGLGRALRCLALPYADHPDYDWAWRP